MTDEAARQLLRANSLGAITAREPDALTELVVVLAAEAAGPAMDPDRIAGQGPGKSPDGAIVERVAALAGAASGDRAARGFVTALCVALPWFRGGPVGEPLVRALQGFARRPAVGPLFDLFARPRIEEALARR